MMQALGASGLFCLGADPIGILANLVMQKDMLGGTALGSVAGKRYIFLQTYAAPARWMFDLFLNPGKSSDFVNNPHMATQFSSKGSVYDNTVPYSESLVSVNGVYVPPIWKAALPACDSDGNPTTTGTLASILPNIIHIRGIDTNNGDHGFCSRLHFMPISATVSTTALTAGINGVPFPAINIQSTQYIFSSPSPLEPVNIASSGNLISTLLGPFALASTDGSAAYRSEISDESTQKNIRDAIKALDNDAKAQASELASLQAARLSAFEVMTRKFPDFDATWAKLLSKYTTLVQRALAETMTGINDKPIGIAVGSRDETYCHNGTIVTVPDLRNMIQNGAKPTDMAGLPARFALLEFIIVNDLSRSVTVGVAPLSSVQTAPGVLGSQVVDEHYNGTMVSLFLNTMYYRGLSVCLLELVRVLKSAGVWDQTVIDISGEFNRAPRKDRTGSDHGYKAASGILLSGMVTSGPFIIGNIYNDDPGNKAYGGTYGRAAPNPTVGNAALSVGHFAASLATMLDAPSPVTAAFSLLEMNKNGTVQPSQLVAGKAKIVKAA